MIKNNIFLKFWFWACVAGLLYVLFIAEGGYFGQLLIEGGKFFVKEKFHQFIQFLAKQGKDLIQWIIIEAKEVVTNL